MGKFFSLFSKSKKKTAQDRKRQASVLHNISKNPEIEWQEPQHRSTVVEGGEAAQRLSVFQRPPQDITEKKQYEQDQQKVNAAVEILKQNAKANREQIKVAMKQTEIESNGLPQNDENKLNNNQLEQSQPQSITKILTEYHETKDSENKNMPNIYGNEATEEAKSYQPSYSGFRIQIDQLQSFHNEPWMLNKTKNGKNSLQPRLKHSELVKNIDEYHKNKRVTLTNSHNFLWFVSAVQSSLRYAESESELTRVSLDKILNLIPIPFRDKIWEICVLDEDEQYLYIEDYIEFVDALLVATGQYDIDDNIDEIDFEIRDMTQIFCRIIDIDGIFKNKLNIDKWSKSASCLSTRGATQIVMRARNLKNRNDITASDDVSIALLTGFTRKAMKHSLLFCTSIYWKLLTDVWWDEDDEQDMALPVSLGKYDKGIGILDVPIKKKGHVRGKKSTKLSENQINSINGTSLEVLFPDLSLDGDDQACSYNKYLKVLD